MPPKSRTSTSPKKKRNVVVEAETPDQVEWKDLKKDATLLHRRTKKEEADFNEFQQQREKLNYFWIVEKKKLEDKRSELRNKERELQDLEEKHQVEIKIYKQRLKHLLLEHQNEIASKKTEAEMALKMAQDDDREVELDVKEDRRYLNNTLKEIEISHEEYIRSLKRDQDQKVTLLRHQLERRANEINKIYESRMKKTRDTLDKQRKDEIKNIEDLKHIMIETLMLNHSKSFSDIKNYYNDITHNNLDLIKSLKEEVKELEIDERKDQLKLHEKMIENKKLSAPLKKMQEELLLLLNENEEYKKEKNDMKRIKILLITIESEHNTLLWEHETLLQRLNELKLERNELKNNLNTSIYDVKQKSSFRSLLLEKKLSTINKITEEREAQLNEVLKHSNLDPTEIGQINIEINDVLNNKNILTKNLTNEVTRLNYLQNEFNKKIILKMLEYGLHVDELGFVLPSPNN